MKSNLACLKKINLIFLMFFLLAGISISSFTNAQESPGDGQSLKIDYQGQSPVDMDLDGLTDRAETELYHTDPKSADTDGDGYYDGTETLSGTNQLDINSIPGLPSGVLSGENQQAETPWPWYVSRISGLLGFLLLYISIFLGLTVRIPWMRKLFSPLYAMQGHCWISFQATVFALVHGGALLFDEFLGFGFVDVFVPFASSYKPQLVAMGTISFYLMVILTATSYARRFMSQKIWRALHFTNIILYAMGVWHALALGTDLQNPLARDIFIAANEFLVLLMIINMFLRIREAVKASNSISIVSQSENEIQ